MPLSRVTHVGWTSAEIIALLSTAVVGGTVFMWLERRASDPMMDLALCRDTS